MMNRDEQTAIEDNEHLTGSDAHVSALLRSLPRAEAPKDFEFKVRARIAQTIPTVSGRPGYIKAIGYAAPFILLLIVAAVFLIRQPESGPEVIASRPSPSGSIQENAPSAEPQAAPSAVAGNPSSATRTQDVARAVSSPDSSEPATRSTRSAAANDNSQPAGSYVTAASQANTILPRGFNQKPLKRNVRPPSEANVDIAETLKTFGIDAKLESGGWTVKAVAADSISHKSGLKEGDVIDSLDERPLKGKTLKGRVEVKSLKLVRDGKPVEITFGPR